MKKAYLYIGSNNETKTLELAKIETIISKNFEGFTVSEVVGYWKSQQEKTAKVEIVIEDNQELAVIRLAKTLRAELQQEAILLEFVNSNIVFIQ